MGLSANDSPLGLLLENFDSLDFTRAGKWFVFLDAEAEVHEATTFLASHAEKSRSTNDHS